MIENLKLEVPNEQRHINARLTYSKDDFKSQQLIIIATGLYSHMDKLSQLKITESYQKAGFSTLQFNFMGHGEGQNKSGGEIKNLTLSSSIKDIKTVWDYSQNLSNIDTKSIAIGANSYGALISLLALEKRLISPESMVLVAPFSLDKFKPWIIPLGLISKLMPNTMISKILKLPISSLTIRDFLKYHRQAMTKKDLLGSTAVHFFVGDKDKISSPMDVKKWCHSFNDNSFSNSSFVDGVQAHCIVYEDVLHFEIPQKVQSDITKRSISFIKKTHDIKSKSR